MKLATAIVVMGVSGSGKTTIGQLVARQLDGAFIDADDLHSPAARRLMSAGVPLTDDDRWPWLDRVAGRIRTGPDGSGPLVIACSALRRVYRDRLRKGHDRPIAFVHLHGDADLLELRMTRRGDHFMPARLLPSQLATLEPLGDDELGAVFDISADPQATAAAATSWILSVNAKPL